MATIGQVIKKHLEIRNTLDRERTAWNAREKELKELIERLENWLLEKARSAETDGFKTSEGTAFKTTKVYVRVGDWDKILEFVLKTKNFQMFEKRIGKLATIEVMRELEQEMKNEAEEQGLDPDDVTFAPQDIGVEYVEEIVMQVRKATKKGK